jgi:hypothetical protein
LFGNDRSTAMDKDATIKAAGAMEVTDCSHSSWRSLKEKVNDWEKPAPLTGGKGGKGCKLVSSCELRHGFWSVERPKGGNRPRIYLHTQSISEDAYSEYTKTQLPALGQMSSASSWPVKYHLANQISIITWTPES